MSKTDRALELGPVKGRPMLNWVGKRALSRVTAFAAQQSEVFDPRQTLAATTPPPGWPAAFPPAGLLFHGDNKEVLATLLTNGLRGKINLIYIDPPFDSGADYVRKVQLRGKTDAGTLAAAGYSVGEQVQYTDIWANDNYLQFMYERLILLKELLSEEGFIAVHLNTVRVHYLKCVMDEVFGDDNYRNEIIVKRIRKSYMEPSGISSLNEGVDYVLLYSKGSTSRLRPPLKHAPKEERWHGFDAPNIRPNLTYELFGRWPPAGRCWMNSQEEAQRLIDAGDLRPNPSTGAPEYRLEATEYIGRDTLWDDITASAFTTGYPTEKKEDLIKLFIEMATQPGDIVLDCFLGSGTTAVVAQKMGRRWIGCDINKGAIQLASKRLQNVIIEQAGGNGQAKQNGLQGMEHSAAPAQTAFAVYRVNDYDLAVQHNEMVALACEQIGVVRSKTDDYFDGTLGSGTTQELVKIVPFQHPASRSDLEEIVSKLGERPDETRGILLVAVGKELTVDSWLDDWNRHRGVTRRDEAGRPVEFVNKIHLIDLRTDAKYGRFLIHQPAGAELTATRQGDQIHIRIDSFLSPTIIERLGIDTADNPLFRVRIPDWRAMVNAVEIDTAYDGTVFHITHSDIPAKKTDLVNGTYQLTAPADPTTIAVKITDMLGEEVLLTRQV